MFDFSSYSKDSKFFDETNKKVTGKMKDEFDGVIEIQLVGLKLKMHSMEKIDGKECNTAKGVRLRLSLINSKMFYLMTKLLDTK